ncbi:radical SAM family heme chaperone HemW [Eubacteriales bacterium OttesenSCG-928-A19]|nr:radical SAM family heme chaperone HemW [Eubacteriales bacterium OttesenSCG-928-A19]
MGIGLYLHIPFCARKCDYCDFASFADAGSLWRPVVDAMKAEMARAGGLAVDTIFFGGGTPTVLPTEMLAELLDAARAGFAVAQDAEITVEANPGTVDRAALEALRRAGVNRLSLGAQAMQPALLERLGRIHRWEDVLRAVEDARAVGFSNINLDLMYGLPGQTPADFRDTLDAAIALSPEHLSLYSLIVEQGTPFADRYAGHPELLPGEDAIESMSDDALWMTEEAGIPRYEISNYARPGFECRHNLVYWLRRDYLGIGCAAHSLLRNHRWGNAHTLEGYLAGEREEELIVSTEEARFERLMLGLRLVEGIPWEEQALYDQFKDRLERLRERGLVDWDDERIWPTKRGLDLQNRVVLELMG